MVDGDSNKGEKFVVTIDPILEELIPEYLEMTAAEVSTIRNAMQTGDYMVTQRIGHNLKGNGGGYGFEGISNIGSRLENSSKAENKEQILKLADELENYINNVEVKFGE